MVPAKNMQTREVYVEEAQRIATRTAQWRWPTDEKRRQIRLRPVRLYDLAGYISAYTVTDGRLANSNPC